MDIYGEHEKTYGVGRIKSYFFTWSIPIPTVFSINEACYTHQITMQNKRTFMGYLSASKDKIAFYIGSSCSSLTCIASVAIGSKTLLLSNSLNKPTRDNSTNRSVSSYYFYDLVTLSSEEESFQKLIQHPNDTLVFICKIKYSEKNTSSVSLKTPVSTPMNSSYHLKTLAVALKNNTESFSKEKVILRVGEETETVSKAVMCAGSPVFAKMFGNDMRELKENAVTITDIKMPVLKTLVSFLYSGKLPICDFDFSCDLYYAADKYDITILRQHCVDLLLPQISEDNVIRVWKLASSHGDELLKSAAIAFIASNIEKWFSTNEWGNLVDDEPKIAAEVLNFLDLENETAYITF